MATTTTFPEEIMLEILVRLPVKSILRCKSLSKHYYSVIHTPFFIRRHLSLGCINKLHYPLIVCPLQKSIRPFDPTGHLRDSGDKCYVVDVVLFFGFNHRICGPVDGLYCVTVSKAVSFGHDVTIWNPATREHLILPQPCSIVDHRYYLIILAFGFGYDRITNDYKVLVLCGAVDLYTKMRYDRTKIKTILCYILNAKDGVWRNIEELFGIDFWNIKFPGIGVFVCGACHWLYFSHSPEDGMILAFDMSMEAFRTIQFPSVGDGKTWCSPSIATLNGCLGLVNGRGGNINGRHSSFDVWVMKDYGNIESWTILYHVPLENEMVGQFLGIIRDRFYVGEGDEGLLSYNFNSGDCERYGVLDDEIENKFWCEPVDDKIVCLLPYEESLVRIKMSN